MLFFGAGVSAAAGLPSSNVLMDILRNELLQDLRRDQQLSTKVDELQRATSLARVAQLHEEYYRSKRGRQKVADVLQAAQRDARLDVISPLRDLPCIKSLLTTNYDALVETVLSPEDYYVICREADMRQVMAERLQLVKLHGTLSDRDSMVLTDDDYHAFKRTRSALVDLAKTIIRTKTLVLVGYSLEDNNFAELYKEALAAGADVLNYFVSPDASLYQQLHWARQGFEHIALDAEQFLLKAAAAYAEERYAPERASFTEKPSVSAGVDPLNNPFTLFDTEALIDTQPQFLFKTFVNPVEFPTILEHQHTFIEGHRGSGKSTILWRMSLRARQFDSVDLPMWGFYVKMVPGLFFAFRRRRQQDGSWAEDDDIWTTHFTHYFNLVVLNGILLNLEGAVKANVFQPLPTLPDVLTDLLSGLLRVDAGVCKTVVQCRRLVERELDSARSRRGKSEYYTGPT
ncbi:MAG: SIR2 family protein, partial [Acidobacteriota bacterium]|nr:SIR2 family protein [Acidobacteriota bacterium]